MCTMTYLGAVCEHSLLTWSVAHGSIKWGPDDGDIIRLTWSRKTLDMLEMGECPYACESPLPGKMPRMLATAGPSPLRCRRPLLF